MLGRRQAANNTYSKCAINLSTDKSRVRTAGLGDIRILSSGEFYIENKAKQTQEKRLSITAKAYKWKFCGDTGSNGLNLQLRRGPRYKSAEIKRGTVTTVFPAFTLLGSVTVVAPVRKAVTLPSPILSYCF
jgi:hypothetical protein